MYLDEFVIFRAYEHQMPALPKSHNIYQYIDAQYWCYGLDRTLRNDLLCYIDYLLNELDLENI